MKDTSDKKCWSNNKIKGARNIAWKYKTEGPEKLLKNGLQIWLEFP